MPLLIAVALLVTSDRSWGESLAVPAQVQAQLLGKLAPYDRNFVERAGQRVLVAIVTRPANLESARAGSQIQGALKELGPIAGLPHEELLVPWNGGKSLYDLCVQRKVTIVYLAPGLGDDIVDTVKALEGVNILTVAGALAYVSKGVMLGFELVSAQTKLVVNLPQAKKQGVFFRADVLRLMRIVQ
jgi:YfiR/HmsC-like